MGSWSLSLQPVGLFFNLWRSEALLAHAAVVTILSSCCKHGKGLFTETPAASYLCSAEEKKPAGFNCSGEWKTFHANINILLFCCMKLPFSIRSLRTSFQDYVDAVSISLVQRGFPLVSQLYLYFTGLVLE